jgi:F420-dependent hydroxymycolic acid dehydrogenase
MAGTLGTADRSDYRQIPLQQITGEWPVGTDPAVHLAAIEKLFESGVTIVNVHSGQADQQKVVDFYARSVLPRLDNRS